MKLFRQKLFFAGLIVIFFPVFLITAIFLIKPKTIEISKAPQQEDLVSKQEKEITIILVGDIMLNRGVKYMIDRHGKGDFKFPFLEIADYLKEADIVFGNLESVISDKGIKSGSIYSFRADLEAVEGLVFSGFNAVSVANNHVFDYGREAMEDSFSRLKKAGIAYIGGGFNEKEAYGPVIKEIRDSSTGSLQAKIAFLAYTNLCSTGWQATENKSGIACLIKPQNESLESWLKKARIEKDIKEAKNLADLIIVSFHYGEEYRLEPDFFQVSVSKAAIDAGADLVVGHHPHVAQPVEKYNQGYIAYSLGNFVFDQGFSEETMKGLLLKITVKNGKIKELIPVDFEINQYFQPKIKND